MGAGNYLPNAVCYAMVYVDIPTEENLQDHFKEEIEDRNEEEQKRLRIESFFDWWHDDLVQDIRGLLPKSFYERHEYVQNSQVIASNKLIDVCLADNQGSVALVIRARENEDWMEVCSPLAPLHVDKLAKRLFNQLANTYYLSVRCGPWTSGKFAPIT